MNTRDKIYSIVAQVPKGNVATYGQIARLAGNPRMARVVGNALHSNSDPEHVPCHRVVNHEGKVSSAFAFGGYNVQIDLLRAEGVGFKKDGYVDLERFLWDA